MKIAVSNSKYVADISALKAVSSAALNAGAKMYADRDLYVYYPLASKGIKPNDILSEDLGRWVKKKTTVEICYIVEDNYDFVTNNATDLTAGADAIEVYDKIGSNLIGTAIGFMDWQAQRDQIRDTIYSKAGNDLSNYISNLTLNERAIAAEYIPTKVSDLLGFPQLITDAGSVEKALYFVDQYLIKSTEARNLRYAEIVAYVYRWLGKNQALQAEDQVRQNNLKGKFIDRGVMYKALDSVDGFLDWVNSEESFIANGLKAKIDGGTWSIGAGGPTSSDFAQKIVNCAENGIYPII